MSRTFRKVPTHCSPDNSFDHSYWVDGKLVSKPVNRLRDFNGYDGGPSLFNMIDGGDGVMHTTNKWFNKRLKQKRSRQAVKVEITREVVGGTFNPPPADGHSNHRGWYVPGAEVAAYNFCYPWDADPFYEEEWVVFQDHFPATTGVKLMNFGPDYSWGYTGQQHVFIEERRERDRRNLLIIDPQIDFISSYYYDYDDYFHDNDDRERDRLEASYDDMGIFEDYCGPDNPSYADDIEDKDDILDEFFDFDDSVIESNDNASFSGVVRGRKLSHKQERRWAKSEIKNALLDMAS